MISNVFLGNKSEKNCFKIFIMLVIKSEGFYWNIDFILVFKICSKYHNNMLNIIEINIQKRKYIHGENDFSWSFMNKSRWNTLDLILICNLSGIIFQWRCWNSAKYHFSLNIENIGTTLLVRRRRTRTVKVRTALSRLVWPDKQTSDSIFYKILDKIETDRIRTDRHWKESGQQTDTGHGFSGNPDKNQTRIGKW